MLKVRFYANLFAHERLQSREFVPCHLGLYIYSFYLFNYLYLFILFILLFITSILLYTEKKYGRCNDTTTNKT